MSLHVELVSPEALVWSGDVDSVLLRTIGGGDIQFLTGHAPVLAALDICVIEMGLSDGTVERVAVRGGFVEVSDDHVKILSDQGIRADHVDPDAARSERDRAQELMGRVETELARSEAAEDMKWSTVQLRSVGAE